jgi:hypothetical protein
MDFSKLSNGEKIAGVAGAVLVINLFLPWYGAFGFTANAFDDPAGFLAWGGSLIAIAGAIILLMKALGRADASRGAMAAEQMAALVAAIGTVLIFLQWITENDFTKYGLYLGILASAAVTFGAYTAMKEKGLSIPDMDDLKSLGGGDDAPKGDA